jgi:hypothetical protein
MDIENHPRCPAFACPSLSKPFFFGYSGTRFPSQKDFSVVQLLVETGFLLENPAEMKQL